MSTGLDSTSTQANDSSALGTIAHKSGSKFSWIPSMQVRRLGSRDIMVGLGVDVREHSGQTGGAGTSELTAANTAQSAASSYRVRLKSEYESYDPCHKNVMEAYAETAEEETAIKWWQRSVSHLVRLDEETREDEVTKGYYLFRYHERPAVNPYYHGEAKQIEEVSSAPAMEGNKVLLTAATESPDESLSGTTLGRQLAANWGDPTRAEDDREDEPYPSRMSTMDAYCCGMAKPTEEVLAAFTRETTEVLSTKAIVSPYISVKGTTLGLHISANLGDPTFADSVSIEDKELTVRRLKAVEESFSNTYEESFATTLRESLGSEHPRTDFKPNTLLEHDMLKHWTTAVENRIRAAGLPEVTVRPAKRVVEIDVDYGDEGARSAFVAHSPLLGTIGTGPNTEASDEETRRISESGVIYYD